MIMRIEAGTKIPIPGGTSNSTAAKDFARDYGRSIASYGKQGGDQAGHIIGQRFGGSGTDLRNIIPIDWDLNDLYAANPRYTNGESYIANLVAGNTVCFMISFAYGSSTRTLRPSEITFEIMYRPSQAAANTPWTKKTVSFPNGAAIQ